MIKFMFHYIAHSNNAAYVYKLSLKQSSEYPWTPVCTLWWSKNV